MPLFHATQIRVTEYDKVIEMVIPERTDQQIVDFLMQLKKPDNVYKTDLDNTVLCFNK